MAIYSSVLVALLACASYFVYQKYVNVHTSFITKPLKTYDYIIVGAGTSGCVLAARLSEDPQTSVLLVEAGDHMGYFTRIPLTATAAQLGPNDWAVKTTSQRYSSFGMWNQSQFIPRGKGLGGSGQINFLLHGFGLPSDFERWGRLGFRGWSYEEMKKYFIKAFGTVRSEFDSDHCPVYGECPGDKAPMKLKLSTENEELTRTFREASSLLSDGQTSFRRAAATVRNGARHSSYDAYLKPALGRRNLHVLLKTQAVSVRFESNVASSVYILLNHHKLDNIFARKEIVLAAGAFKTPQILMVSGVGPRKVLESLKLQPVSVNEAVGSNLHDHVNMPLYVSVARPLTLTLAKLFSAASLWNYFWDSSGPLSFPPVAGVEFHGKSSLMLFSMGTTSERLLRELSNYKPKVFRETYPFHNASSKEGFLWLCGCLQPRSRGRVTVADARTLSQPTVDMQYLYDRRDVDCIIKAMRRAEKLIASAPFKAIGAVIHWPRAERCLSLWNYSAQEQKGVVRRRRFRKEPKAGNPLPRTSPPDEYLACVIREVAVTGHHAGGTCAGGRVVDELLRVKSLSGLRIMDASVLPSPTSLFPNSILVAMAERAADIIRNKL